MNSDLLSTMIRRELQDQSPALQESSHALYGAASQLNSAGVALQQMGIVSEHDPQLTGESLQQTAAHIMRAAKAVEIVTQDLSSSTSLTLDDLRSLNENLESMVEPVRQLEAMRPNPRLDDFVQVLHRRMNELLRTQGEPSDETLRAHAYTREVLSMTEEAKRRLAIMPLNELLDVAAHLTERVGQAQQLVGTLEQQTPGAGPSQDQHISH